MYLTTLEGYVDPIALVGGALAQGLAPDPDYRVSEWAADYRVVAGASSLPGKWSNDVAPYGIEIADLMSPSVPDQYVAVMKCAQAGVSEIAINAMLSWIDLAPGPIQYIQASDDAADGFLKEKLAPAMEASKRVARKIAAATGKDRSTDRRKVFPGGFLLLSTASSANSFRQHSVRYQVRDDVDQYPEDVDGQGDALKLADSRTIAYPLNKKVMDISSPTVGGSSRIEAKFKAGDQRYYRVPCPHCGHFQRLVWDRLSWQDGRPETAAYKCIGCDRMIPHTAKRQMLRRGVWVPEAPGAPYKSYHISSLYSPFVSWADMAAEFLSVKDNPLELMAFINTKLGEVWVTSGEAPDWQKLRDRAEEYEPGTVPCGAVVLTAGADVQQDRIEVSVWGWGRDRRRWLVDHVVLVGDTADEGVWSDLDALLVRRWPTWAGSTLSIDLLAIDSGYRTQIVYEWARRHASVMAIKGARASMAPPVGVPTDQDVTWRGKRIKAGVRLWPVGTWALKAELYARLSLAPMTIGGYPTGYVHMPLLSDEYYRQLTGERLVTPTRGKRRGQAHWVPVHGRVEALDCAVYARAAAMRLGVDRLDEVQWSALEVKAGLVVDAAPATGQVDLFGGGGLPKVAPAVPPKAAVPATARGSRGARAKRRPGPMKSRYMS